MAKFNNIHNDKTSSTLCGKKAVSWRFHALGILIISLMAFAPAVDAGCSCSAGNWDPSGFLNSELGTGQPVQSDGSQASASASQPKTCSADRIVPQWRDTQAYEERLQLGCGIGRVQWRKLC